MTTITIHADSPMNSLVLLISNVDVDYYNINISPSNRRDFIIIMSNETLTTLVISVANKSCTERFSLVQCYLTRHGQSLVYLLLAVALLPQIFHLYQTRHRYVAGVSYLWIIIRIFALMLSVIAHSFKWLSILKVMGLMMSIIIFSQIVIFTNNLHRQNKIIFVVVSTIIWIGGISLIIFFVKEKQVLINIIQILFAVQMIPQVRRDFSVIRQFHCDFRFF